MTTIADCIQAVSLEFNIPIDDLLGDCHRRCFARPRHVAMWLARRITGKSMPIIARTFNKRDHSAVLHACRVIENLRQRDRAIAARIDKLLEQLAPAMTEMNPS